MECFSLSSNPLSEHHLLADQLCFSVYESHRLFNKVYARALSAFDLTYTQYIVLLVLFDQDGQRLTEIAQTLSLKSNTLTPLLKRLEGNGWLFRKEDIDKRSSRIFLSQKALDSKQAIFDAVNTCLPLEKQADLELYRETLKNITILNTRLAELNL